MPMQRITGVN